MQKTLCVLAMMMLLGLTGCTDKKISQAEEAATMVAENWIMMVDKGQFEKCWETSSAFFKNSVPQDKWLKTMQELREPMGNNISRKVSSTGYYTKLYGAPEGEYVVIKIEAGFENKASSKEMITLVLEEDGKWRVAGYYLK